MNDRTLISSGSPFEKTYGYSRAVVSGDEVHVAGTTGYDYAKMTMPDDIGEQTRNIYETFAKVMKEAGGELEAKDLRLSRILNAPPEPYTRERFDHTYQWTLGWGLTEPGATFQNTVDNRAWE